MQFLVFLTAALGSVALAQQPTSSTVNFVCATRYALQPTNQIRTTTFRVTTTNSVGRTVTVNPRTTRTVGANTFTVTNTFTSFSTVTAASSVATATAFVTATSTQVSTVTQTFTSATVITITNSLAGVTSTVAEPAGFTALGLSPGFVEKRDSAPEPHHPHIARAAAKGHLPILPEVGKKIQARQNSGQEFPVGILCTSRTTFFVTGTATSTRAGPTTTITITQPNVVRTVTTTITGAPRTVTPAGTTRFITVTSTTLRSATTTSTTVLVNTNTVNINGPAATAFAQCSPANLISSAFFGNQIGTVTINSAFTVRSINVTDITGLECCDSCARLPTCAGFAQQSILQGGACFQILNNGVCDGSQNFGNNYHYYQVESGLGYTVGNAQCGQLGAIAGPPNDGNS
ncbi:hypothetical protein CKM354_000911100 [Cercospora kikuchii]|uniref:Apple domain-containing protein n=1 Tax=Cercospora kikuchii TaxID=84275 RepID=A0A9P3CR02_9PEZI|nr:uncharacterized protein CKM354_000911100 [Cercospora kikuchii]GIZ45967.1 hypothetical protein CKM354_000911100 [Cercospora kikuchii]